VERRDAVRNHRHGVELEELWDIVAVVGELIESVLHRGMGIPGVLQLEDGKRQPVDEDHEVGAAVVLTADWELIDHQELVPFRLVPVDGVDVPVFNPTTGTLDTGLDPAGQGLVEGHVTTEGVDPIGPGEAPKRVLNCARGQIRVLPGQEGPQVLAKNDLFERPIELDAVDVAITETLQPFDGGELKLSFAAPVRHELVGYPE
jgi:hypothetical protein